MRYTERRDEERGDTSRRIFCESRGHRVHESGPCEQKEKRRKISKKEKKNIARIIVDEIRFCSRSERFLKRERKRRAFIIIDRG